MIHNAKIVETFLGVEDHGIFTFMVTLDCGAFHQGFGGWSMDIWSPEKNRRVGNLHGMTFLIDLLNTLEISQWEKLKGTVCRVENEEGRIVRIGHFLKDQWFDPKKIAES